jgi:molybdenum cofactor cytidylyltransferase
MVFNPDYERGMITSFQTGIRALPAEAAGAMLFLVDHPAVEAAVIEALLVRFEPGRIVLPVFQGRRGHPVLFSGEILREVLALTPHQGANIVVRKDPSRILEVPVDSRGVLLDVDTPDDFRAMQNEYETR